MTLWTQKLKAFGIHLAISLAIAALAAALVFLVWYPYPYREISGGRGLFMLIVLVDIVLGPLITLVVFNPRKSRREKWLDFGVIGLIQFLALVYGLWSVMQARPVYTIFERDHFRVVHANEIVEELLPKALPAFRRLPLDGPSWASVRAAGPDEEFRVGMFEAGGVYASMQPDLWRSLDDAREDIFRAARPASELAARFRAHSADMEVIAAQAGTSLEKLLSLPLLARKDTFWTVFLDPKTAKPIGYLPLDPY